MTTAVAAIAATGLALTGACDHKEPEFAGVGKWRFGHTTLHDATGGICQPTDLNDGRKGTWCFALPPFKIAKSTAEVDLYFLGAEPTAPLIELQLKVRGCHEDEVEQWMRSAFGPPIENKSTRAYWKNSFLWAAALLPSEPGRCLVHFLPISENAEIDRIKQL
ncbi:MAG TPA: hypothetical protein VH165_05690 [Kofleriaceae bacterium]|jgi:hypothetical protein|nr:hypothetical protein [Kofleriaceae bacterium]